MNNTKPTQCIDPEMMLCQECKYGHCIYPEWVETIDDLQFCTFETCCIFGFDKKEFERGETK